MLGDKEHKMTRKMKSEKCSGPKTYCFQELDRVFLYPALYNTYDSHRHSNTYCTSVFPLASICKMKAPKKIWLMGMSTSDSQCLREMASLIVGFYWLLYTPFASFMAQKDREIPTAGAHRDWTRRECVSEDCT